MKSLLQVVSGRSRAGADLPEILPSLTQGTIRIRQNQLHVICGLPGRGKTLLALWYAITSGLKVLYCSYDSDEGTVANRCAALLLDKTTQEIKDMRETDAVVEVEDVLFDLQRRVRFAFDAHPTMDDVVEELDAWGELFGGGSAPDLLIVDNLLNIRGGSEQEFTAMRDHMAALHGIAREYCATIVLHHVNGSGGTRVDKPADMNKLMGQVSQLPETIISVALDDNRYHVAAVKNRDGLSDPKAERPITLAVDPSRMALYDNHRAMELARTKREWQ